MSELKPLKSQKLRYSAMNQNCTMNVADVCNYDNATVVLAHIKTEGSAMGAKPDDFSASFACCDCHTWLDQNKGTEEDRLFYSLRGLIRTLKIWVSIGLITIK